MASGATRLHAILKIYRQGSGQLVNKEKSAVFFSGNCTADMKQDTHLGSGISSEALMEKYLGLPTALGRSTDEHFELIIAMIKKLARGWIPKTLSSPGREVLVKAICQAIPTYSMSCFMLSKKMCQKSQVLSLASGGVVMSRKGNYIGGNGTILLSLNILVEWGLGIFSSLIKLC
jgi:hypothetical protein